MRVAKSDTHFFRVLKAHIALRSNIAHTKYMPLFSGKPMVLNGFSGKSAKHELFNAKRECKTQNYC